jgi:hypothetical protein
MLKLLQQRADGKFVVLGGTPTRVVPEKRQTKKKPCRFRQGFSLE